MAGPWEKYQTQPTPEPSGPWAKYAQPAAPAEQPGFIDRVGQDWKQRGQNLAEIQNAQAGQQQTLPESTIQTMGQLAGGANDLISEGVVSGFHHLPQRVQDDFRGAGEFLSPYVTPVVEKYQEVMQEHPRLGRNLDAAGNLLGMGALLPAEKAAANATVKGIQKTVKAMTPEPVLTPKGARWLGSKVYKEAEASGAVFPPHIMDEYLNKVQTYLPQTPAGKLSGANKKIAEYAKTHEKLRGTPMDFKTLQEMEENLGNIADELSENGMVKKAGLPFVKLQKDLREIVANAANTGLVTGAPEGIESLQKATRIWADSYKLRDIERIERKAGAMANPAQARQNGFRNLMMNDEKFNTYTPEEQALIKRAATATKTQDFLRTAGSRLNPLAAAIVGYGAGGPGAALAAGAGTWALSSGSRALADALQARPGKQLSRGITHRIGKKISPQDLADALKKGRP